MVSSSGFDCFASKGSEGIKFTNHAPYFCLLVRFGNRKIKTMRSTNDHKLI